MTNSPYVITAFSEFTAGFNGTHAIIPHIMPGSTGNHTAMLHVYAFIQNARKAEAWIQVTFRKYSTTETHHCSWSALQLKDQACFVEPKLLCRECQFSRIVYALWRII